MLKVAGKPMNGPDAPPATNDSWMCAVKDSQNIRYFFFDTLTDGKIIGRKSIHPRIFDII